MASMLQESVIFVGVAIVVILMIARLATAPVQAMLKLLINSVAAVLLLCMAGMIGRCWGVQLPINPVTILLVAILGLPGLLLVTILHLILV